MEHIPRSLLMVRQNLSASAIASQGNNKVNRNISTQVFSQFN
jgi:hypothetical protein